MPRHCKSRRPSSIPQVQASCVCSSSVPSSWLQAQTRGLGQPQSANVLLQEAKRRTSASPAPSFTQRYKRRLTSQHVQVPHVVVEDVPRKVAHARNANAEEQAAAGGMQGQ